MPRCAGSATAGSLRSRAPAALIAAALVAALAGCAALIEKPVPPQVRLESVRVSRFTPADTRFTLVLAVENANAYDLAVTALDATLAVEGEPLATAKLAAPTVLAAGAATRVAIDARTGLGAVVAVLDRFARQSSVRYEVTGVAVVQDGWRLPFARSGQLAAADFLGPPR
jgi:hypothetical protein